MEKKAQLLNLEIWKPIKTESGYEVSNLGRVRSVDRCGCVFLYGKNRIRHYKGRVLAQSLDGKKNYRQVNICGRVYSVHRLVAEAFVDNPNDYKEVNHKDENKQNNEASNLEWCDHRYNSNYGSKKLSVRGERNPCNKFSEETIREIRREYIEGDSKNGLTALSKKYGISLTHTYNIIHRKRWGWVI